LTSLFRSLILLLFVGGLAAFFLINPAKWLPSQIPELLLVRVHATPDLQAWFEDARRRFLANSPRGLDGRCPSALITKKIPWPARGLSNGCSRVLRRHPLRQRTAFG
jgi:hypothetical protein